MEIDGATVTTDYGGSGAATPGRATTATTRTAATTVDGATGTATAAAAAAATVMATAATAGDAMDVVTEAVATDLRYDSVTNGRTTAATAAAADGAAAGGPTDAAGGRRAGGDVEEDEAGEEGWEDPTRATERGTKMIATAGYGSNPSGVAPGTDPSKDDSTCAWPLRRVRPLVPSLIDLACGPRVLSVVLGGYK